MKQYLELLSKIRKDGVHKDDRTGTGTQSIFGHQMRFDLNEGFPLTTTKKIHVKSIIHELIWFLRGETNIGYLKANGVSIWDEWADENGDLGPIYGDQWRSWPIYIPVSMYNCGNPSNSRMMLKQSVDQLAEVIQRIRDNPNDRRLLVSAWNVGCLKDMALPPCHLLFQFYVADGKLSCQMYQRSCDTFLGVPYNIASYALLTHIVAHMTGLGVGEFIWVGGDTHIYSNHQEQVVIQLKRKPKKLPKLVINCEPKADPGDYTIEDFTIEGYEAHPHIAGEVAV